MIFINKQKNLIDVVSSRKAAEKDYDDIIWDYGVNDPRLAELANQIQEYEELEKEGITISPNFWCFTWNNLKPFKNNDLGCDVMSHSKY